MADFSNIDVKKLVVAWEEEEDLWTISGGGKYHKKDARHRALSRIQEKLQNERGKNFTGLHFFNELKKFRFTGILV